MSKGKAKEIFPPDHRQLSDWDLLQPPRDAPLTAPTMFVSTYVAKLTNLRIDFRELTRIICSREQLELPLVAFNSNFGHRCRPGYEGYVKEPRPPKTLPLRGHPRKVQGDGTCFNSAIEPILVIAHPGIPPGKVYKVKCFPTTGETQVPGTLCADLSDGHVVLREFVGYLNRLGVGAPGPDGVPQTIEVASEQPNMLNYKFRVNRSTPRMLIDLRALTDYMDALESTRVVADGPQGGEMRWRIVPSVVPGVATPTPKQVEDVFATWPALVPPPYVIRETKPPTDDVKMSFKFTGRTRFPRVNVFQEGKINLLGADSFAVAAEIYDFFTRLFAVNWGGLMCLQPRRDGERARGCDSGEPQEAITPQEPVAPPALDAHERALDAARRLAMELARAEEQARELAESQARACALAVHLDGALAAVLAAAPGLDLGTLGGLLQARAAAAERPGASEAAGAASSPIPPTESRGVSGTPLERTV